MVAPRWVSLLTVDSTWAGRDFLTGFHKRKLQRQKRAIEEAEEQLRKARKQAKKEVVKS